MTLESLDDDTLIYIFSLLPVESILTLRQTCTRLATLSRLRFIWQTACINQVLKQGYPFPICTLADTDARELERQVLHALRLANSWVAPLDDPKPRSFEFQASSGTGVSHVCFFPGRGGRYIVTVYKGIWSIITCWDIGRSPRTADTCQAEKVADWCPKNIIFAGFVINSDPDSDAALAVSIQHGRNGSPHCFRSICNIATTFRPIALKGDLIAFSDDACDTVVMNWRENTFAHLKGSPPINERFQYNRCLQVIFAYESVLVVRARSVELFPAPELRPAEGEYRTYSPIGFHTFGWIDGVSVETQTGPRVDSNGSVQLSGGHEPLSILLRAESDDPWASDVHKLEQFVLNPNPTFRAFPPSPPSDTALLPSAGSRASGNSENENENEKAEESPPPIPYIFPPVRAEHTSPTVRGFLRCRDIALGPSGTALWIQPRPTRVAHLTGFDVHSSSTQVAEQLDPDFQLPDDDEGDVQAPTRPGEWRSADGGVGGGGGVGANRARTAESLCAAVFAGPLQRRHPEMATRARTLWVQRKEGCNWTAFDYDEESGRVALGSTDGSVTVLDLV